MQTPAPRIALVTGANKGIGFEVARQLGRANHRVLLGARDATLGAAAAAALCTEGVAASCLQLDLTDMATIRAAAATIEAEHGRLDVLVNNAGIAVIKPLDELSLDDFDRSVAVNVRAVFVAAQEAARHMRDGGRIVTIGSVNADRMPFGGGGVYAMTKAAVAGLARGLARDLGPRGITVNVVQPGPVETDMNPSDGPFAETLKGFMAIKRFADAGEIAGMVSYLASPEAAFITGASLTIDGGFAA